MQGPSFISGRAAVIGYQGEGGGGGSLVIKTALEIHGEPAAVGREAGDCVHESVEKHTVKVRPCSEITSIFKLLYFLV